MLYRILCKQTSSLMNEGHEPPHTHTAHTCTHTHTHTHRRGSSGSRRRSSGRSPRPSGRALLKRSGSCTPATRRAAGGWTGQAGGASRRRCASSLRRAAASCRPSDDSLCKFTCRSDHPMVFGCFGGRRAGAPSPTTQLQYFFRSIGVLRYLLLPEIVVFGVGAVCHPRM